MTAALTLGKLWWGRVLPELTCLRDRNHLRVESTEEGLSEVTVAHTLPNFGPHGSAEARWDIRTVISETQLSANFPSEALSDARRRLQPDLREGKRRKPRGRVLVCKDLDLNEPIALATYHVEEHRDTPIVVKHLARRADGVTDGELAEDSWFAALVLQGHLHAIDAAIAASRSRPRGDITYLWYEAPSDQDREVANQQFEFTQARSEDWQRRGEWMWHRLPLVRPTPKA